MTVGALCDLGVKPSTLEWELSKLDLGDFHMHFDRKKRGEIEGVKFSIHAGATHSHDCDHEHEHAHDHHNHECGHDHHGEDCGHAHEEHEHCDSHKEHKHSHDCCGHDHDHSTPHEHTHDEAHEHDEHCHSHEDHKHSEHSHDCCGHDHGHSHDHASHVHTPERRYTHIRDLISKSELSPFVKEHALSIFHRIALAESKIHGTTPEEVHFHEVGALDSIADVVCACVGIETLGIKAVFASELQEGHGWIQCDHGQFPIPAPATLEILNGIPLRQTDEAHELITPTGAAILAEFSQKFGLMPPMKTTKIGYGVGTRELASRPNVLRAVLGESLE
ncbi:MAG: nickel insertion protein [Verrucomicrobiota bacterium]